MAKENSAAADQEKKCRMALAASGVQPAFCGRLSDSERDTLAKIWDEAKPPHAAFNARMDAFYAARQERLEKEKATDDICPEPKPEPKPKKEEAK